MAIERARAFIDIHHLSSNTAYEGNDFSLIVNDGSGNAVINSLIDETVYTGWSVNGDGTGGLISPSSLKIFPGYITRSLNVSANNNWNSGETTRLAFIEMAYDTSTGKIIPNNNVIDASQFNLAVLQKVIANNGSEAQSMMGALFCDSDGKPITRNVTGTNYIGFGMNHTSRSDVTELQLLEEIPYPSSPTNQNLSSLALDLSQSLDIGEPKPGTYQVQILKNSLQVKPFLKLRGDTPSLLKSLES